MAETKKELNYFQRLSQVNVNDHVEKKNNLSYLSWSYSWSELKSRYPMSTYTIYERDDGVNYFTDGRTCWVKVGVTVPTGEQNIEHVEHLPVMDFRNNSIPVDKVTSYDVNKAIQRALTKAIARHGLGIYIYAGEDLPISESEEQKPVQKIQRAPAPPPPTVVQKCFQCGKAIEAYKSSKESYTAEQVAQMRAAKYGVPVCGACAEIKRRELKAKEAANASEQLTGGQTNE